MTSFGPDLVAAEVARALHGLAAGLPVSETKQVDFKEEAGRRLRDGTLGPSTPQNDVAARALTAEAACMANTRGGGALLVGVADDGTVLGTQLDAEWLRRRIYELSQRLLTVTVFEHEVSGRRVLELRCVEAVEPVRINNRITWRVDTSCVEVDAATWHELRHRVIGFDWSAQPSSHPMEEARSTAVERAREYLRESAEERAADLSTAPTRDLLTRLNVVTPEGFLTNAGALAFIGRDRPALDYVRRDVAGGDSLLRLRESHRSLLEELWEVERAVRVGNQVRHLPSGLVSGQIRELPPRAVREAVVNGCAHRDWTSPDPTVVEHVGPTLVVTSPGGFIGGVNPQNIITHPSQPRHRALAELLAALRIAEREGIGVDRMVHDMVRFGYPLPAIEEIPGPYVRTALVGPRVDVGWLRLLGKLEPARLGRDLNTLLTLREAVVHEWVDVAGLAPVLQRSALETEAAVLELVGGAVGKEPVLELVDGVPVDGPKAWRLSTGFWRELAVEDAAAGSSRRRAPRTKVAVDYARARGRISSTELASIVGADPANVGLVLKRLESEGLLRAGREQRRGPGFFYVPA